MMPLFIIKPVYFLLAVLLLQMAVKAQDPVYSQPFLAPVYLNPAATGAGEYNLRVSAMARRQWRLIPSKFNSMAFSVDKHLSDVNGGLGLLVTHSGAGYLNRNGAYGTFSYTICGGTSSIAENGEEPEWFCSGGLQLGIAQTKIDYGKLVFADQLNTAGVVYPSVSSADPAVNSGRLYPDFAAGFFFNYVGRLLVGFSAHHINRPDESLTSTTVSPMPVNWMFNFVYSLNPTDSWLINFTGTGYRQFIDRRYQVGFQATHNDYSGITVGLFYGGSFNKRDIQTIGVTASFNLSGGDNTSGQKLRAGLAHDAQVGNQGYMRTGGSSELGILWDYDTGKSGGPCKPKINPYTCPEFRK